jgi:hypothetical protein
MASAALPCCPYCQEAASLAHLAALGHLQQQQWAMAWGHGDAHTGPSGQGQALGHCCLLLLLPLLLLQGLACTAGSLAA